MQLASRFASRSPSLRSDTRCPMTRSAAWPRPSSRTPRTKAVPSGTAYIPTATVLTELRKEGFQPFMVTQTRVRHEGRASTPST
jgi:hypothetical protein